MTSKNTDTPVPGEGGAASKTKALIEASRARQRNAAQVEEDNAETEKSKQEQNEQRVKELAEGRQELADVNVQARDKSLTGEVDPMAMGDVKGDGGDAKDYDDNDPAKRLGITTAEHGLNVNRDGTDGEIATAFGHRVSKRTQDEMQRGRDNLADAKTERRHLEKGTTAVTDAEEDEDGKKGDAAAATAKEKAEAKK